MSLMGTSKHNFSSHAAERKTLVGHDEHDLPRSSADSPDLPAPKLFRSPQSSASPAPKVRTSPAHCAFVQNNREP